MRYDPDIQSASIVLLGKFNPPIFSPAWFARTGILSTEEAETATTEIIHQEIAKFKLDRLHIEVLPNRFVATSTMEPYSRLLDEILKLFSEQLPHSPIDKLGINYEVHFKLENARKRNELGRALAPTKPWGELGKRIEVSATDMPSGMVVLVMQESSITGREKGWRRVQIEPSVMVPGLAGVRIQVNDHFEITSPDFLGATPIMGVLRANFDVSLQNSKKIVSQLMDFASSLG